LNKQLSRFAHKCSMIGRMGKFGHHLLWYRQRREAAATDLVGLETGNDRHFDLKDGKKIDVTQELIDHLKREIDVFDRLIVAREALNAKGS
jgi:hypothetical protein